MFSATLRSRLLFFVVGGLVGVFAGAVGMLIAFPYLFPPAPAADAVPVALASSTTPRRAFTFDPNAPGRDSIHWADGNGVIARTDTGWVLRLEGDFKAGPGPNYWIYVNTGPVGEESDFNADNGRVRLAKLRSFEGAQNYVLPADFDASKFHTVTIWCESFGAYIGSGVLKPLAGA